MIPKLKAILRERAGAWGIPASSDWKPLVYNNYHPHCSDVDVFWFRPHDATPSVVTKVSNRPGPAEREFGNLQQVYPAASKWVPRPLEFSIKDGWSTLWMEGVPATQFQGPWTSQSLASVIEVVAAIHSGVFERTRKPAIERWTKAVQRPLEVLAGFGASERVREGCASVMRSAAPDWLASIPSIPQHGDLYVGNVLFENKRWYIVDWESFGLTDLPGYDVYTLLLSALRVHGNRSAEWSPELMAQIPPVIGGYAGKLKLTDADLRLLLPIALANWFYVQWSDGRREFSVRLYEAIDDYFEHLDVWERVFVARGAGVQ